MPNVFVLCSGRNGSVTFAKACAHITNYSSGHESLIREVGNMRFAYPKNHIEIDNRLSFFLGALDEKYGDEAIYIHLTRDADAVARSYNARWHVAESLMKGWGVGIARQTDFGVRTAKFMVHTIEQNIKHFLRDKSKKMVIHLETLNEQFPDFLDLIEAEGDRSEMTAVLAKTYNVSTTKTERDDTGLTAEQASIRTLDSILEVVTGQRKDLASANKLAASLTSKLEASKKELERTKTELREVKSTLKSERSSFSANESALKESQKRLAKLDRPFPLALAFFLSLILFPKRLLTNTKRKKSEPTPKSKKVRKMPFDDALEAVRSASDPVLEINSLLRAGRINSTKAVKTVRTLFTRRDPAFFRIASSKEAYISQTTEILSRLYVDEYQGKVTNAETLLANWAVLASSDHALTRLDEQYFLLAAVKSESIECLEKLLSSMTHVNAETLPSTYKTGILRLVGNKSPESYSKWRSLLELSELDALNVAEFEHKIRGGKIQSHADFMTRLPAVAPAHLKGEIGQRILPFFEAHSDQLTWMDCRFNSDVRSDFISLIAKKIIEKQPWSLIRLGDGESYAWQDGLPLEHAQTREYVWWGAKLEPDLRAKISEEIYQAIASADVLGIPSLYRFARDTRESLESYAGHRSISGLLRVLDGVSSLPSSHRQFTEDRIHQVCFDLPTILDLAGQSKKVVVVSSVVGEAIGQVFSELSKKIPVVAIPVPTHTKTQGNALFTTSDKPLPFLYKAINEQVAKEVSPGSMVIVASGSIGKIFCETARQSGGVALDVGAMADYWVGAKTRSISDKG